MTAKKQTGGLFDSINKMNERTRQTKRNTDINIIERVAQAYGMSATDVVEYIGYDRTAYANFKQQGSMPEVAHQCCELLLDRKNNWNKSSPSREPSFYIVRVPDKQEKRDAFTAFMRAMDLDYHTFN